MTPTYIKSHDIPDAFFSCLYHLYDKYDAQRRAKEAHSETLRKGHLERARGVRRYKPDSSSDADTERIEFDHITIHITNPGIRPLLPQMPEGSGLPEVCDPKYLDEYMLYLLTDDVKPQEHYTYGSRLLQQFWEVIEIYKKGYNTLRCSMSISTPDDIMLYQQPDGSSPCLREIGTKIQDGKLHWFPVFRSWNAYGGLPLNLAALQQCKELMAGEIGVEDGEIIAVSHGLALRSYNLEFVKSRLKR